jgi:hypothetical protein
LEDSGHRPAREFERDLRRLKGRVKDFGEFSRRWMAVVEAGIRDAREGKPPRY